MNDNTELDLPKVIAHCEKCGREFVLVNPNCKTDPLPFDNPCGGRIILHEEELAETDDDG